jgi:ketosteroid isomerase-like protein
MIGRLITGLTACACIALAACAQQDGAYVEEEATVADAMQVDAAAFAADLDALQDAYAVAYNAGDAAGLAALFTEDAMMSPPLTASVDLAGIEASYVAQFEAGIPMTLEIMREDFFVSGNMAVGWGAFQVTAAPPEGEPFTSGGRYGSVLRMEPDGTWKIFRHMFNYEVPPPGFGEM